MTPAEIHQAKRAHVRQQAERWAAAADTTGNHALSTFVQLVRDALRDLEALEGAQNAKCGGCDAVRGQGRGAQGSDQLKASGGPENAKSMDGDLPTARMMSVGALRMCELGIAPLLRDAFSDARDIWRAMEAARPRVPDARHSLSGMVPLTDGISEEEISKVLGDPRVPAQRLAPNLSAAGTAHPSDFIYPAKPSLVDKWDAARRAAMQGEP